MNLKFGLPPRCAMLSTLPVTKLSMPMILWPRASSRSTRCEPRKPAAPVTTEVGCRGRRILVFCLIGYQVIDRPVASFCSRAGKHRRQCAPENGDVKPQRPMVDVFQVEPHPILEIGDVVAAADLPETGEARLNTQPAPMGEIV